MINRETTIPMRRSRRYLVWAFGGIVILLLTLRSIASFWIDFLWFDSVDQTGVWRTLIFTRVWLVLIAAAVAFLLFYVNLALVDRLSPPRPAIAGSPDEEILERFQSWVIPRRRLVKLLIAGFFGLTIGLGAATWWEDFLLFRFGGDFGIVDPIYNNDVGFYVFQVPFLRSVFGWTFQLFLVIALVTAALHYLNGGIQVQAQRRVGSGVKVHLSILFAVLALLKAFGYTLDRWDLLFSTRGQVFGASFTDVNAQRPALNLLILISVVAAIILLVNLRFRGWTLPAVALGLWLFTSIAVGGIYPAIIQRFQVQPDEIGKEVEFVAHNIEFTRDAYGLATVDVRPFNASPDLDVGDLGANRPTIDNIRLWDPSVLNTTYRELQEIRTFYGIEDVDVDRYTIDGELTQVMVSARELDEPNIPVGGWVNERLVYTHGFGAVLSPANAVTDVGQPAFLVRDIPPVTTEGGLNVDQPRIYFSDRAQTDYVIAATTQPEVDFPIGTSGDTVEFNSYEGSGGIRLGGFIRRAAFALRFGDVDTLLSGRPDDSSRVLLERNVLSRLEKVAPFLHADADPYLVILDGQLQWVVDLYTISDRYPYSQNTVSTSTPFTGRLDARLGRPGLPNDFNYIRNPVKAVVDAYDGTMTLYVEDATDPLLQAQQRIFPRLFTPGTEMPQELREHLRYPQDLFRIQSDVYTTYHITDPAQFFSIVDPWQIARDPSTSDRPIPTRARFQNVDGSEFRPMLPYYLLMRLPGESDLAFLIMQPFTPQDRPNMVSFMVAKSGPDQYGQLIDYRLPADRAQQGPGQVGEFINQNPDISAEFTLLGQGGSRVIQGNMQVIPIEESLLYVQPIYIAADASDAGSLIAGGGGSSGIPEFKRVVVSFDGQIEMKNTLDEALAAIFGAGGGTTPPVEDGEPGDEPGGGIEVSPEVAALLASAQQAFDDADAALAASDLATYATKVEEAQGLIEEAVALLQGASG
ncbi:MAG: UPF0182 family protein [Acidimicrobiia bacterium]